MDVEVEAIRQAVTPYVEKLKGLTSPDAIKDFLLSEDIKARQGRATQCAVAMYLQSGSGCVVGVSQNHIYAFIERCVDQSVCSWPVIADNTPAMKEFVYNFDDGFYPELVG
jgi:hypothetical protein